jgi:hypothetical protein
MSDDRAAISALVLTAMGDAWSDSEEYSALPGVVADLLLMSDWLAAKKVKWQAEERERIAVAIEGDWKGDFGWDDEPDHPYVNGMKRAAIVARREGAA